MERFDLSASPALAVSDNAIGQGIALFIKGAGPGGVERIAWRLAQGWQNAGVKVSITVGRTDRPMAAGSGALRIARDWPMARLTWSMWRQLRRDRPAVLFCPGNAYTCVAVLLKITLGNSCPPVVAKVSNDLQRRDMPRAVRPFYRLWLRIQGRMIDHFAVLSAPMAEEVIRLMRVPPDRVHIVPNPVLSLADCTHMESSGRTAGAGRRFVAVGRLERQKNYPAMLRAFAAGAQPGDRLTVYGIGHARNALMALATSLGIADRVDFAGYCADVRTRLRDHDILLLTSLYEGQPGVIVEALSVGLGIIATRCCAGMADLLDDGALGTLVENGDSGALARAIVQATPGQQDVARARLKARAFTIEAAIPAYLALFAKVAAGRDACAGQTRAPLITFPSTRARPV